MLGELGYYTTYILFSGCDTVGTVLYAVYSRSNTAIVIEALFSRFDKISVRKTQRKESYEREQQGPARTAWRSSRLVGNL